MLEQDGSPPLYYMLLHFWIGAFGTKEVATHTLSLIFSTLAIPAGLWAGWSLFGRTTGIITGILCAGEPFITVYAQETRMYSLVALLSIVCAACFLHVFALRRRRYLPWFAVSLALLLYTHFWSAFFVLGAAATVAWLMAIHRELRRDMLRDALLGFGGAALVFLPWLPTALYQLKHTGAPWAEGPTWRAAEQIPHILVGTTRQIALVAIVVAFGILAAWRARRTEDHRVAWTTLGFLATMVGLAWIVSNASGVWVPRYFAIFVGPLVIGMGWAFARAGLVGLVGLAILMAGFWLYPHNPEKLYIKSNMLFVAKDAAHSLGNGDLVINTHPEQTPLSFHYLNEFGGKGMRYADEMGYVPDTQVFDWRDCVKRLRATRVSRNLEPLLARVAVGHRVYLIRPIVSRKIEWLAPWTSLVKRRSEQWIHAMDRDKRFKLVHISNAFLQVGHRNGAVQGRLYLKTHS